jgi:hypothetical protein
MIFMKNILCALFLICIANSAIGQSFENLVGRWKVTDRGQFVFNADTSIQFFFPNNEPTRDTIKYDCELISAGKGEIVIIATPKVPIESFEGLKLTISRIRKNKIRLTLRSKFNTRNYDKRGTNANLKRIKN